MRSVTFSFLAALLCTVSVAQASTTSLGQPAPSGSSAKATVTVPRNDALRSANKHTARITSSASTSPLALEQPVVINPATVASINTIESLVKDASTIHPWLPERGSIGVRLNVTW